ncbi:MAG: hypothetical protein WBA22_16535 [Candidatus Methanofastidiosia archaeon]
MKVGQYTVETSNEDRVFFPQGSITKGDLIQYYKDIAPIMLPHVKDRPVTMHRFPSGIQEEGFYHKEIPDYFPPWVDRVTIEKKEGGTSEQVVCNNAATLVYLANQACITLHTWLSRIGNLNYPDKLVFDLDPSDGDFGPVRAAALSLKERLIRVGLQPFVMTTGSRGVHVAAPLDGSQDFDTVRTFAKRLADSLAKEDPRHLTSIPFTILQATSMFLA